MIKQILGTDADGEIDFPITENILKDASDHGASPIRIEAPEEPEMQTLAECSESITPR
jgi:hypothetical protein